MLVQEAVGTGGDCGKIEGEIGPLDCFINIVIYLLSIS